MKTSPIRIKKGMPFFMGGVVNGVELESVPLVALVDLSDLPDEAHAALRVGEIERATEFMLREKYARLYDAQMDANLPRFKR